MPDVEGDLECEICRRTFPSPYLLQMHKYYFHGPGQEAISPQEPPLTLHPHPLPHEQLRQLALHAQQQARSQQTHQKRIHEQQRRLQEQQRRLQEHQQRLQKHHQQQQEEQREAASHEERSQADEGGVSRAEDPPRPSVIESAGSGESDASEDLRKLQSMILQLNRQDEVSVRCRVCSKELGNKYFLRAHMMTEHGVLGHEEVSGPPSEGAQTPKTPKEATLKISPPSTPLSAENQAFCSICKKDFFSRYILQQHLLSAHGVFTPPAPPTSFMERIKAEVEGREERKPQSTSRSYCEICNKELCNKYFMKTHMLKMHGINVENGVTGGVTCDLCNKELCSKYFLRVHKQNTHGMVEEGREGDEGINKFEIELCPLCPRRFKNRKWLKTHLTSDHDEVGKEKWREMEASWKEAPPQPQGPACVLCGHVVSDMVALQLHIIKVHSPQDVATDRDSRTSPDESKDEALKCSFCPFTAPNPALLFAHSRNHVPGVSGFPSVLSQTLPCSLCPQVFTGLETYQNHLLQHHLQGLFKPMLEKENNQEELKAPPSPEAPTESTAGATSKTLRRRKRWRCSQCGRRFKSRTLCLAHVHATHNPRARGTWLGRPAVHRRLYKCRKCGAMASRLTDLRQHIREQHQSGEGVPTSHATPTKPTSAGRFVMQPFLLNDGRGGEDGQGQEGQCDERQFVPSLVYLPVARRVHHPLTVSFSLTPA
uniref:C2H2-type domain-containing protein n=1 Tax=Scylla olivacea TaxID=85551 RepID=A0A0N7ZCU2_SCYOL